MERQSSTTCPFANEFVRFPDAGGASENHAGSVDIQLLIFLWSAVWLALTVITMATVAVLVIRIGRVLARVFAYHESILLARRGIGCLAKLPDSAERVSSELSLELLLGSARMTTEGFGDSDGLAHFRRATELCQRHNLTGEATARFGLWAFHLVRGEFRNAVDRANELLDLARISLDRATDIQAHYAAGFNRLNTGLLNRGSESF